MVWKKALSLGLYWLVFLPALVSQHVFADGLFQENIQGNIAGRNVNLFVRINPPILTTQTQQDTFVQLRLFDGANETIKFTTFIIEISKATGSGREDRLMTPDAFHTESGLLTLRIQPQEGPLQILATREDFLNAWKADPGGTVNIRGPILLDSGLYHFKISVIGVDNIRGLLPPDQVKTFDTYLSVGDVFTQNIKYKDREYSTTLISYYDKVQQFTFDQDIKKFSWSIPFNWDIERIRSTSSILVHQEIRIPNSFENVGNATAFDASINGIPISKNTLAVDPYSSKNDLTLHFIINRDDIIRLAQHVPTTSETMEFAFSPASDNGVQTSDEMPADAGGMIIRVQWTPDQLAANKASILNLEFYDGFSGDRITGNVIYDLRIFGPDGSQVHSLTEQVAKNGSDSKPITFPVNATYRIEAHVKGIIAEGQSSPPDTSRNGIARGTVVIPEFPITWTIAAVIGMLLLIILHFIGCGRKGLKAIFLISIMRRKIRRI